ncbi:MAG: hypothetical protein ACYC1C_14940 [Chloroflexota bacterium]
MVGGRATVTPLGWQGLRQATLKEQGAVIAREARVLAPLAPLPVPQPAPGVRRET